MTATLVPEVPAGVRGWFLPSGRWATVREVTIADSLVCAGKAGADLIMRMAREIATIDGEPVQLEDLLFIPKADTQQVLKEVGKEIVAAGAWRLV